MKILLVSCVLPTVGGVGNFINNMAISLRSEGHKVDILSPLGTSFYFKTMPYNVFNPIKTIQKNSFIFFINYNIAKIIMKYRIRRLLSSYEFDLIHAHDVISFNSIYKTVANEKLPIVLTVHASLVKEAMESGQPDWLLARLSKEESTAYENAKYITTVSDELFTRIKALALRPISLCILRNMVDVNLFKPCKREFNEKCFVLLSPNRLTQTKGVIYALKSLKILLRDKKINIRLIIAGEGPVKNDLMKFVNSNDLSEFVIFKGLVDFSDMVNLYQVSDAVIIPSLTDEGTPMAILEAMACGVPVIASNVGGISSIIANGKTGLLVNKKDPQDIANKVLILHKDSDKRNYIINNALDLIRSTYSNSVVVRKIEAIYENAILTEK
jgi:glycosyltransferase involved in cell wall biosynthesis